MAGTDDMESLAAACAEAGTRQPEDLHLSHGHPAPAPTPAAGAQRQTVVHLKGEKHVETSAQSAGEQSVAMRLLLACGAIGSLLNIVVLLVLGATRPGYNAWQIPDSNLELGVGGWIQITNYLVTGALMLGFAIGLRRVLHTGCGSTWGPILLGIYGLSFIGMGIFVTDPVLGYPPGASSTPTVHGTLHDLFGQLQFISLIAA